MGTVRWVHDIPGSASSGRVQWCRTIRSRSQAGRRYPDVSIVFHIELTCPVRSGGRVGTASNERWRSRPALDLMPRPRALEQLVLRFARARSTLALSARVPRNSPTPVVVPHDTTPPLPPLGRLTVASSSWWGLVDSYESQHRRAVVPSPTARLTQFASPTAVRVGDRTTDPRELTGV